MYDDFHFINFAPHFSPRSGLSLKLGPDSKYIDWNQSNQVLREALIQNIYKKDCTFYKQKLLDFDHDSCKTEQDKNMFNNLISTTNVHSSWIDK